MAKKDIKTCAYTHCKHESQKINIKEEEYEVDNNRYFHPDCKHEKDTVLEIIDYWCKNIDENVVFSRLRRIVDDIVYKYGYEADYVLFALKKKARFLNYPPGLFYAIKDKTVKADYEHEKKLKAFHESQKKKVEIQKTEEPSFTFKTDGKKTFGDIFGGK